MFFSFNSNKLLLIPVGNNIYINNNNLFIYFSNDVNLYKNYYFYFKYMIQSWDHFVICKIKFRYKGSWIYFRWKKKRFHGILLEFGRCHRVCLMALGSYFFRKKRLLAAHLFSIYGVNVNELISYSQVVRAIRPFSMYTMRGIRFARQKFYKRVGKVSKYTMFKSKIF